MLTLDSSGRIRAFDAEAERLFHCRAGDVLDESVCTLLPAFPHSLLASETAAHTLRLSACPRDGSLVPVELVLSRVRFGPQTLWSGVLLDLARHQPREERLRRSEEVYRTLFERALIGIYQTSPEGHYLRVNAALAQIYG